MRHQICDILDLALFDVQLTLFENLFVVHENFLSKKVCLAARQGVYFKSLSMSKIMIST